MKFLIYAPYEFTLISGGIIALHKLADNLSRIEGIETYILTEKKNDSYGGIKVGYGEAPSIIDSNTIVVYPEIVAGNPLAAKRVVRWILNTPGVAQADKEATWKDGDRYFLYDKLFTVKSKARVISKLSVLEPFMDIFKETNTGERKGTCHLFRKGNHKPKNWHPKDSICIDDFNGKFEKQAEIFNQCETFISYDDHCFTTTQAALCGCLVIVVPNDKVNPESWYADLPTHKYGQSYGLTGINHAIETQPLLKYFVEQQVKETFKQTLDFVNYCKFWVDESK